MSDYVTIEEMVRVASDLAMFSDDDDLAAVARKWYYAGKEVEMVVLDQEGYEYLMSRDTRDMLEASGFLDENGRLKGYMLL